MAARLPPPIISSNFQSASNSFNAQPLAHRNVGMFDRASQSPRQLSETPGGTPALSTAFYSTQCGRAKRSQEAGACTGLCNTPIPETETSTLSPATIGPTPAGVPVAITSPGTRVIIREIQRIRNSTG